MTLEWVAPPIYAQPALVRAREWNDALRDNQAFLHKAHGFRLYVSSSSFLQPTNELQTVIAGGATGGSYRLAYNGVFTQAIAWNAPTYIFLAALKGIPALAGTPQQPVVHASGTSLQDGFTVLFKNGLGGQDVAQLTKDDALLVGDTVTIATITNGDPFFYVPVGSQDQTKAWATEPGLGPESMGTILPGLWRCHAHVKWTTTSGMPKMLFRKNTGEEVGRVNAEPAGSGGSPAAWADLSSHVVVAAGESVGLYVNQTGLETLNLITNPTGIPQCFFEAYWKGVVT